MSAYNTLLDSITSNILNPVIGLMFLIALIYFLWGVYKFVKGADNPDEREVGSRHIIWGLVGMAIMVSAYSIIQIIGNTVTGL